MIARKKITGVLTIALVAAGLGGLTSAEAAIVKTEVNTSGDQTAYAANVSTDDLIDSSETTLGSFTSSHASGWGGGPTAVHDGSSAGNSGRAFWISTPGEKVTLDYTLAGSATGYDITSINTIYGHGDHAEKYVSQRYDVLISTVTIPTFTALTSVAYDPFTANVQASTQVTLTDTTGVLASGVTGIRFIIYPDPTGASNNEIGIIHEYDVFGTATPPPATPGTLIYGK